MKELFFKRFTLHHQLTVACTVDMNNPHLVQIDQILLAGLKPNNLPFAWCPKHQLYFGISADVDMDRMVITLREISDYRHNMTREGRK